MDFILKKMPEGGYLVADGFYDRGSSTPLMMFASTTIDEALKFIKSKLEPKNTMVRTMGL